MNSENEKQLTQREINLVNRGYDKEFIIRCNEVSKYTKRDISREIFDYIVKDCCRTSAPAALFIGGQPGCGKSTLSRKIRAMQDGLDFVDVCLDNYRTWHPFYTEIEDVIKEKWIGREESVNDSPGNDIADFTHRFSGEISDILIEMLTTPKDGKYYSICMEWGMRTPDEPLACMKKLKEKGYRNEVIYLCVPGAVSLKSSRLRSDYMNSGKHIYRRIPDYFHQLCIETIVESCKEIFVKGCRDSELVSSFSLRDRDNHIIFTEKDFPKMMDEYKKIISCTDSGKYTDSREEAGKTFYVESIGLLKNERWFSLLMNSEQNIYNVERVSSVDRKHRKYVLNYVEKTLSIAETAKDFAALPEKYREALIRSLQWSEIAKSGTEADREKWRMSGLDISIHNLASAEIYLCESDDDEWTKKVTFALIACHGMPGQILRGETDPKTLKPLLELIEEGTVDPENMEKMLLLQNEAVIRAASEDIWKLVKADIGRMISVLCTGKKLPERMALPDRIRLLFPKAYGAADDLTSEEKQLFEALLTRADLWYPTAALDAFSREEITAVFTIINERIDMQGALIDNISFEKLMKTLYYDYEGKRRINVYKKRVIEYCLKEYSVSAEGIRENSHVKFSVETYGTTLLFDVKFTSVCEKLLDFCVEAERSGLMEYQKNIVTIFDLFGFRRDTFDRLNNEEKYLETMNDTAESRKNEIVDYVTGDSAADVGSGGGVLLDLLEKSHPEMKVIGTDISSNVIEALESKIQKEGHSYSVIKHNFVEGVLEPQVDNIIFSSILHEIYSYTVIGNDRFVLGSVKMALENAVRSLKSHGRIIIRDGILSQDKGTCSIRLKTAEGITFAKNYLRDFEGLKNLRMENGSWDERYALIDGDRLIGDINLIREFLYTYTWGIESYSCEINEQFGYFRLDEYVKECERMGLTIIHAESYLEPGYPQHLDPLVELEGDLTWEDMPSSCLIVAEKI